MMKITVGRDVLCQSTTSVVPPSVPFVISLAGFDPRGIRRTKTLRARGVA